MSDLATCKEKGNGFFKQQKYTEAIEWYTKAIAAGGAPQDLGAIYSNRAASFTALKKYQEAIADSEECVKCRPDWVKGYFRKATALEALGNLDECEKHYAEALKREPSNGDIQDRLASARKRLRERNERITPEKCTTANEAKQIGNSLFKAGSYDRAIAFYTRATELAKPDDPERATYFVNRATCYGQTSSHKQVIADCDEALSIQPDNAKAYLRRALAFEGLEKWQQALDDFRKVTSMGLNSAPATQGIVRCQRALRG